MFLYRHNIFAENIVVTDRLDASEFLDLLPHLLHGRVFCILLGSQKLKQKAPLLHFGLVEKNKNKIKIIPFRERKEQ